MTKDALRRWYLAVVAAVYLVLCSASCLYSLSLYFRPSAGTAPVLRQLLCLAFAVAAGVYFLRPRLGHIALAALTGLTLIAMGNANPGAAVFHFLVLVVLLFPPLRGVAPPRVAFSSQQIAEE